MDSFDVLFAVPFLATHMKGKTKLLTYFEVIVASIMIGDNDDFASLVK